jgi:hypothetical protein
MQASGITGWRVGHYPQDTQDTQDTQDLVSEKEKALNQSGLQMEAWVGIEPAYADLQSAA